MATGKPIPEDLDTADALVAIRTALAAHPESSEGDPEVLDLEDLRTIESVFQPRDLAYREGEDEAHLQVLTKAAGTPEKPTYLEAITVWWGGDNWYILDGHHRRIAYERAKIVKNIPVRAFTGSLDEAMAEAVSLNSKDKMPMRLPEKMNKAWQLVVCTELKKSQIVTACSVADGSVAAMRRVKRELATLGRTIAQMLEMTWEEARLESQGKTKPKVDHDTALEMRARGYATSLAKAVGDRPHKDPEGFALALLMLDSRLPRSLLETNAWAEVIGTLRDDQADLEELESAQSDY
ncbi:hypothetical protein [Mesorhizobium sp.]|uniref:hypothetical protein n=1 Tax=Mesorhizobium sp. TaxID=1871066 RepID=UPI0025D986D8|nr:hypothetical protein [Mesorhizobium sp.]